MTGIWHNRKVRENLLHLTFSSPSCHHVRLFATSWAAALTLAAQLVCSSIEGLFCFKSLACPLEHHFCVFLYIGFLGFSGWWCLFSHEWQATKRSHSIQRSCEKGSQRGKTEFNQERRYFIKIPKMKCGKAL